MGLFNRVVIDAVEEGCEYEYRTERRGTQHGSVHKKELSRLGGKAMKRDSKPDGFLFRDRRRP